jgi:predicted DNA-binding protein with PD1-like motif
MTTPIPFILPRGTELLEGLTRFCRERGIFSGQISGIGAVKDVQLGYFDVHRREYLSKDFGDADLELLSLNGNVSLKEGEVFVHLHAVVSDERFQCFGGHLFRATVAITAEMFVQPLAGRPARAVDPVTGLHLLPGG